jgi:hypothetical protein
VVELGYDPDLAEKAGGSHRGRNIGTEHLYRDGPIVSSILGDVDGGMTAASDLALDEIAIA